MAIYKLIANGSFGPDEIEIMKSAYEAALIDVGVTVTATGERDPLQVRNAP
jgi:hypothetical protein